jgi:hypothetical protein
MLIKKSLKPKAIKSKGSSIDGSIAGASSLLMLAGWCRVFHQSTENLIIGTFTKPTRARIAPIFEPLSGSSKPFTRAM